MFCVGRDFTDHPVPWAKTPSTRQGYSQLCPVWPWTLPSLGQPQLLCFSREIEERQHRATCEDLAGARSVACLDQPHLGPPHTHPLAVGPGIIFKVIPELHSSLGCRVMMPNPLNGWDLVPLLLVAVFQSCLICCCLWMGLGPNSSAVSESWWTLTVIQPSLLCSGWTLFHEWPAVGLSWAPGLSPTWGSPQLLGCFPCLLSLC